MTSSEYHKDHKKKVGFFKSFAPKTLFLRSLLILVTPIFLIQIITTYIFFDNHWVKVTTRLAYAISGEVAFIGELIETDFNTPERIKKLAGMADNNLNLLVTYNKGEVLDVLAGPKAFVWGWESNLEETLRGQLDSSLDKPFTVDVDFREKWVEVRVQLDDGVLNVASPQRRLFSSTTYIFLLWVFGASIVLLVISVLFMRNQIRPIRRLAVAAERFGKGREVRNFKIEGAREVRQAGQAFVNMKTRLRRQISQRTDMLAGVSHDLRTPLTRLKLQMAMLGDSPDVYEMKKDIAEMEKMIEGYLNFVRGEGREKSSFVDIGNMLRDVTVETKRQGCDVALELNDVRAVLSIKPVAFKRCLTNIVTNATKYGSFIWITLYSMDDVIQITVDDNGPGLKPEQYDDVFKPFYRVDGSRNSETGGVGLGLPIAMDIVNTHGGEIWLSQSPHGGLSVNITLPK